VSDAVMGRIVGILDVDGSKFTAGMAKAKGEFSGAHADMTSKSKGISSAIGMIGTAMAAVGATAFLKDAIKSAIDDEVALTRLRIAVNATGQEYGIYAAAMDKAAISGIALGYEDATTTESLAQLTIKTGSAATALKDLSLAQDLSRGTGMDLASASSLIAKVEGGRIGIAARILPFLKTTMTSEEALGAIRERMAGQAAAHANTAAGASERWAASYDKLQEAVGYSLLPSLTALVDIIAPLVVGFAQMDSTSQAVVFAVTAVGAASIAAATGFAAAAPEVVAVGAAMLAVIKAAQGLGEAQGNSGKGTAELTDSMIDAGYRIDDFGNIVNSAGQSVTDMTAQEGGLATAQTDLTIAVDGTITAWKEWQDEIDPVKSSNEAYLRDIVAVHDAQKKLTDVLKTHKKGTAEATLAQDELNDAARKAGIGAAQQAYDHGKAGNAAKKYADRLIDAAVKSGELTKKQGDLAKKAIAAARAVNGVTDAIGGLPTTTTVSVVVKAPGLQSVLNKLGIKSLTQMLPSIHIDSKLGNSSPIVLGTHLLPQAEGGVIRARSGGVPALLAENGFDEINMNMSPANRSRNLGLLSSAASALGVGSGGNTVVLNLYGADSGVSGGALVQEMNAAMAASGEMAGRRVTMGAYE
jgi:hypothetical protein